MFCLARKSSQSEIQSFMCGSKSRGTHGFIFRWILTVPDKIFRGMVQSRCCGGHKCHHRLDEILSEITDSLSSLSHLRVYSGNQNLEFISQTTFDPGTNSKRVLKKVNLFSHSVKQFHTQEWQCFSLAKNTTQNKRKHRFFADNSLSRHATQLTFRFWHLTWLSCLFYIFGLSSFKRCMKMFVDLLYFSPWLVQVVNLKSKCGKSWLGTSWHFTSIWLKQVHQDSKTHVFGRYLAQGKPEQVLETANQHLRYQAIRIAGISF